MNIQKFATTLFGALLALLSCSAMGGDWPPTLNPDPEVQPPKWDWQLKVPVQLNPDTSIKIYDIDMFENENNGAVKMLHDKGYKVICYVDIGSWEDWRDDKDEFPSGILGATYDGFPDERWLDIRDVNPQKSLTGTRLATILEARLDRAKNMGCDAVEPDNMDGYDTTSHESTGFPLTYDDQIFFNLWVAAAVHERQMLVGLKNDINQAHDERIYNTFDFVVSEQCFQYGECDFFSDFLAANKPVFEAEYGRALSKFCPEAKASRISAIKKRNSLNSIRSDCSDYYASQPPANLAPTAAFTTECIGLGCTFTDTSTDVDGTVTAWNWDFGDGNSSVEQNPSHTYTSDDTYTVSLQVTDEDTATNSISQSVPVSVVPPANQSPTAAFTSICIELVCTFTDKSTDDDGTVTAWNWDFGDGNGSVEQNPSHTYTSADSYTVILQVTDNDVATNTTSTDVIVTVNTDQPIEATFISIPGEDGWVRESGENSNVGGSHNIGGSGAKAIRFGDDINDRQYKSILSFDTSGIPDDATIVSVTLQLTRGGTTGTNPFNTHDVSYVDIKNGEFGGDASLQDSDFQAAADADQVATITNQGGASTVYAVSLSPIALGHINKSGRTQLRLYFSLDDNNDGGNDYVGFYSANNSNAARHPRLILVYQE